MRPSKTSEISVAPMAGIFGDPFSAFRFSVEIEQHEVAGFSEVSGLVFEIEVKTLREGGVNDHDWQLAGPSKYPSRLVLKRGLGDLEYLWAWYLDVAQGRIARREIAIYLNDVEGTRQRSWRFREACPVKWTGPELRANTSAVAFESIEVVHRGLA
jgi:phage tail-like protein